MSELKFNPLTVEYILKTHQFIIDNAGGLKPPVVDRGRIESILYHMEDDRIYPEFLDKLCHLFFSLNKNHAFNDGNKRVSIAASAFLLEINGYDSALKQFQDGMEEPAVWLASNLIEKATIKNIVDFLLHGDLLHIAFFIEQAKKYRIYIDKHEAFLAGFPIESSLIPKDLLEQMVAEWLGEEMQLSESTKLAVLEAIAPEEFGSNTEDNA